MQRFAVSIRTARSASPVAAYHIGASQGAAYFITFRLADSLPQPLLNQWRDERAIWLRWHPPPLRVDEQREYEERFVGRVQVWLEPAWVLVICGGPKYASKSSFVCSASMGRAMLSMLSF
jgi:hypothetical protein